MTANKNGDDFDSVNLRRERLQTDLAKSYSDTMQDEIEKLIDNLRGLQVTLKADEEHVNVLFEKQKESAKGTGKPASPENVKKVIDSFYKEEWEKVGVIGVDAGLCWIGDPCYVIHKETDEHFETWDAFLCALNMDGALNTDEEKQRTQFNYKLGHPGLGVCVGGFGGDGTYPVYIKKGKDGLVKEVKVVFSTHEFTGKYGK